ncbi:MAG: YdcF family protein [Planctomycetes bacterium]|nr:YdcF family protein [Planctomycetota bacterium]
MSTAAAATTSPRRTVRIAIASSRGWGLFLAVFTLSNIVGELSHPGFDANLWWIDLRFADPGINRLLMLTNALGLLAYALCPRWAPFRGWLLSGLLGVLMAVAALNAWTFWRLIAAGGIYSQSAIPLSAAILLVLVWILVGVRQVQVVRQKGDSIPRQWFDRLILVATVLVAAVAFPLAQMVCFGLTDYRRPADIIVVFGCYVRPDGVPSMALSDRVKTGVELYKAGLASKLVFSGGPGPGAVHETEAMRTLAIKLGVPGDSIELDRDGLNTQATVRNLVVRSDFQQPPRVLAVSNYYHLPRIKLCFRRAGWEVCTVPARDSRRLYYQERLMLREVVALWWYYLNPN